MLEELLIDKDQLNGFLEVSGEYYTKTVSETEIKINKGIITEWEQKLDQIRNDKHTRNRKIVKAIFEACEDFESQIAEAVEKLANGDEEG